MKIRSTKAGALTRAEVAQLVRYCDGQREDYWEGVDLQGLLDVYHANRLFDGVDAALEAADERDAAGRLEARAIVRALRRARARARGRR